HNGWGHVDEASGRLQHEPTVLSRRLVGPPGSFACAENARAQFVIIRKNIRVEADQSLVLVDYATCLSHSFSRCSADSTNSKTTYPQSATAVAKRINTHT